MSAEERARYDKNVREWENQQAAARNARDAEVAREKAERQQREIAAYQRWFDSLTPEQQFQVLQQQEEHEFQLAMEADRQYQAWARVEYQEEQRRREAAALRARRNGTVELESVPGVYPKTYRLISR